jgi:hypothetical protein
VDVGVLIAGAGPVGLSGRGRRGLALRGGRDPLFLDHEGFWAMPLPDGRVRLFFSDDAAGERPEVADGQGVIDRHVPGAPRIRDGENRACFRLHHRVARRFRCEPPDGARLAEHLALLGVAG